VIHFSFLLEDAVKDLLPANIKALKPYIPGKPIEEVQRELGISDVCKLASNENPLGPSPKAMAALGDALAGLNLYPDGSGFYLRRRLAEVHGVGEDQVVLGNGSVDVIEMACRTFLGPEDNAVMSAGAFIMCYLATQAVNGNARMVPMADGVTHDLGAMAAAVDERTKLLYIANPNNPTGTMVGRAQLDRFFERLPDHVLVIMDEAYFEYMDHPDYPDSFVYLRQGLPVIILRTFSKAYGLAGLRVGYGVADESIISGINKIRSPFNTNSLSQLAAMHALEDREHLEKSVALNRRGIDYLQGELDRLGVAYTPSFGNFILVTTELDAAAAFDAFLREGVIVRPMAGYGYPKSFRVSTGRMEENERFIRALEKVTGHGR
jgi:histidinol-phosphate aminotransferase